MSNSSYFGDLANMSNDSYSNLTNVWGDVVQLSGSRFTDPNATATVVLCFIAMVGLFLVWILFDDMPYANGADLDRRRAFSHIDEAIIFLLLSYVLEIIDLFLHEYQVSVKEGYFFTSIFRDGFFQISDLLVLLMICRLAYYQFAAWGVNRIVYKIWRSSVSGLLLVLTILALYRFGVNAAYVILSLNGVSYPYTMRFAIEEAKLATAYAAIYFILAFSIFAFASYFLIRHTKFKVGLNIVEVQVLAITIIFIIRSLTRLIIIANYYLPNPAPQPPQYLPPLSEALYGLPTLAIIYLMRNLALPTPFSAERKDILREAKAIAMKELAQRRRDADKGGPSMTTERELMAEIERNPGTFLPAGTNNKMEIWDEKEVKTAMQKHFKDVMTIREKMDPVK